MKVKVELELTDEADLELFGATVRAALGELVGEEPPAEPDEAISDEELRRYVI